MSLYSVNQLELQRRFAESELERRLAHAAAARPVHPRPRRRRRLLRALKPAATA